MDQIERFHTDVPSLLQIIVLRISDSKVDQNCYRQQKKQCQAGSIMYRKDSLHRTPDNNEHVKQICRLHVYYIRELSRLFLSPYKSTGHWQEQILASNLTRVGDILPHLTYYHMEKTLPTVELGIYLPTKTASVPFSLLSSQLEDPIPKQLPGVEVGETT